MAGRCSPHETIPPAPGRVVIKTSVHLSPLLTTLPSPLPLAAALVLAACGETLPADPLPQMRGSISGQVATTGGEGVAGVAIALSGARSENSTSDDQGRFVFSELPVGSYTVTISAYPESLLFEGTRQTAEISSDGGTVTVDFQGVWPPLEIPPLEGSNAVVGASFDLALEATGGDGTYAWSLCAGGLPPGLELDAAGVITGISTAAQSGVVTLCVTSGDGQAAERELVMSSFDALEVCTCAPTDAVVGAPYADSVAASGGDGELAWSIAEGELPQGLTLSNSTGEISGTPVSAGDAEFTVAVESGDGQRVERTLTLAVRAVLEISTDAVEEGQLEIDFGQSLQATGGDGHYLWSIAVGALPGGLDLEAESGAIRGVPTAPGTFDFTVGVVSGDGQSDQRAYSASVVLHPSSLCVDHGAAAVASFADGAVEQALRTSLGLASGEEITCGDLPALTRLSVHGRGVESVLGLQNVTELESLALGNNDIQDLSPLSGMSSLKELFFENNAVTDLGPLADLTGLTWLGMANNEVADLSPLSATTQLVHLTIVNNSVVDLGPLSGNTGMTHLFVSGNRIEDLSAVAGMASLNLLWASSNEIADVAALAGLSQLSDLLLDGNEITQISALSTLTSLARLHVGENPIVDLEPLSNLSGLGILGVRALPMADLSPISQLTGLSHLFLSGNELTDITLLAGLTQLEQVRLDTNLLSDITVLGDLAELSFVDLDQNADLSNLEPLLDNPGIGEGDRVDVMSTDASCEDVAALEAKGVFVLSDCS
jgi:Leucine-rich repeat (LRR) protein